MINKRNIKKIFAITLIYAFGYSSYVVKLYFATSMWHWNLCLFFGKIPFTILTICFYLFSLKIMKDLNYQP